MQHTDGERNESHEMFLTKLGDFMQAKPGIDTALTRILVAHILTPSPEHNAVALAREAILKLASERAHGTESEKHE